MAFDKDSFLMGLAVGRAMSGGTPKATPPPAEEEVELQSEEEEENEPA